MSIDRTVLRRLEPVSGLSPMRLGELAGMCRSQVYLIGTDVMALPRVAGQLIDLLSGELKIVLLDGSMRLLVGACDMTLWPTGYKTVLPQKSKAITESFMESGSCSVNKHVGGVALEVSGCREGHASAGGLH